ncbi:unnamed protein product [Cuscuta epithymum]|uniref:UspA domain-containing protein n=1 Tax=Cuscuta epithymum TaxID=186058 RepID=A0AAV0G5I5_9ASTE|nr:unnamed protein product [Cuscuta epithymum]
MITAGYRLSQAMVVHVSSRSPVQAYKRCDHLIMGGGDAAGMRSDEFSSKNSTEMSYNSDDDDHHQFTLPAAARDDDGSESTISCSSRGSAETRVLVVVDGSNEAKAALQWALSHSVHTKHDTLILLLVTKPFKQGGSGSSCNCELDQTAYDLLCSLKHTCQTRRPGVQVEIVVEEGKEKGAIIVESAKQQRASLLVLGQRKRSVMWHMRTMLSGKQSNVVNYCIHNAHCMTIAVRRKCKKHGGYLITTKSHKNFWLLA